MMNHGWMGYYAEIDLSERAVTKKKLPDHIKKAYLGSRGINSKLLYDHLPREADPLGPENPLIFGVGALGGTLAPGSGRWTVTAKSPMSGILGDANAGGHWGPELKYAGFDNLLIQGQADRPVYLYIEDGEIEIRDASHLWGKKVEDTTDTIQKELGDSDVKVLCIGPAGENQVKFACVISERTRAAGRTGMGAVMGSKNLKAIATRGRNPVAISQPEPFKQTAKKMHKMLTQDWPAYEGMSTLGTMGLLAPGKALGWVPVNYFNKNDFPYDDIAPEKFEKEYKEQNLGCFGCPVGCGHYYQVKKGRFRGTKGEGPEYENAVAVGPKCGIFDMEAILTMNTMLNEYGLDTIDTGNAVAVLMELQDKGYIDEETLGLDLGWGNVDTAMTLIEKIAYRDGIGDVLAEGSYRAVEQLNAKALDRVMHIKKVDNIGVDIRTLKGASLSYAASTRGLDHLRGLCVPEEIAFGPEESKALFGIENMGNPDTYEEKPEGATWLAQFTAAAEAASLCLFNTAWICSPLGPKELAELLTHATGLEYTESDVFTIGHRIYNLERLLLTELGVTRQDDYPPKRVFEEPVADGPRQGETLDPEAYEKMLDDFYELMGWDKTTGAPTQEILQTLNITPRAQGAQDDR